MWLVSKAYAEYYNKKARGLAQLQHAILGPEAGGNQDNTYCIKKPMEYTSSGRMLAYLAKGPGFQPQHYKRKTKHLPIYLLNSSLHTH